MTNESRCPKLLAADDDLQLSELTNHKNIPHENIIKRKSTDLSRMIATIEEELSDDSEPEEHRKATVTTSGPITVHSHTSNRSSSVYSVCESNDKNDDDDRQCPPVRKLSKSNLVKEINGGYDSVKRMLQKTMSVDRSSSSVNPRDPKIQKPPRKFLTLDNRNHRKSHAGDFQDDERGEDTMSLKVRSKAGSTGDLASDTCSLPDKIPTTPPPKKNGKKSTSFINLMKSNLKF